MGSDFVPIAGNGQLITRGENNRLIENGCFVIEGSLIKEVGDTPELRAKYPECEFIDMRSVIGRKDKRSELKEERGKLNVGSLFLISAFSFLICNSGGIVLGGIMRPLAFGQLMDWALAEYEASGSIFGVNKLFYMDQGKMPSELPELPFGPAAGPHTQLAQNLVAGYVAGGRFFELKTVQILDGEDLPVSKPCILAEDEGYNVEWSTELYVPQAMDEYIKGWYALKLLSREFGFGDPDGFVYNMSVGYDLAGIKTQKIDSFIEGLKNAENTEQWKTCKAWAVENLPRFRHADREYIDSISPEICRSVTLSTLHGCPPDEIERIAAYLLAEKGLHTFVKCNPTLLGYEYARKTLDKLGFDYVSFDDHHFKNDLQFEDAVPMFSRLISLADSLSLTFGVKLTNTFPVQIRGGELPGEEMYMSGRALFPLSIEVVNRLANAFGGKLRISYSGGADINNIRDIIAAGIWPVTLATTLLKPGGYMRLHQIAEELGHTTPCSLVSNPSGAERPSVDLEKLRILADSSVAGPLYRKPAAYPQNHKLVSKLPILDCYTAPCRGGCPIEQDIPAYLRLAGEGKYLEALRVITERNPLPFITGTLCPHRCTDKCTRTFYESAVDIRAVKLEAASMAHRQLLQEMQVLPKSGKKIAVIGSGPAGLSVAYFLARAGLNVTIFEKRGELGGVVRHVIPGFRISGDAIDKDIELIKALGVEIRLNCEIKNSNDLRLEGFTRLIAATGAWKPGRLELKEGSPLDAIEFLERLKKDPLTALPGANVAVVGGGNTAMDAARAAKRAAGVKRVCLVYRRTRRYMPADAEELAFALEDGVEFCELLSPVNHKDGVLVCERMKLGAPDASGRRSPEPTGETIIIPADVVVSAVGNLSDAGDVMGADYVIGDAADGPATIVEAIADAIRCAETITGMSVEKYDELNTNPDVNPAYNKKGVVYHRSSTSPYSLFPIPSDKPRPAVSEPERCLECSTVCECCVDVCPNRANIAVSAESRRQIVHVDYLCNECGNCETFCPYSGAPYKEKFTLFACEEDFENSENPGFLPLENGSVRVRIDGKTGEHSDGANLPNGIWGIIIGMRRMEI